MGIWKNSCLLRFAKPNRKVWKANLKPRPVLLNSETFMKLEVCNGPGEPRTPDLTRGEKNASHLRACQSEIKRWRGSAGVKRPPCEYQAGSSRMVLLGVRQKDLVLTHARASAVVEPGWKPAAAREQVIRPVLRPKKRGICRGHDVV